MDLSSLYGRHVPDPETDAGVDSEVSEASETGSTGSASSTFDCSENAEVVDSRIFDGTVANLPDDVDVHSEVRQVAKLNEEHLAEALRQADEITATRRAGRRPSHYTTASTCAFCGPVWLWDGAPAHVLGCPWCVQHAAGDAFERPEPDTHKEST